MSPILSSLSLGKCKVTVTLETGEIINLVADNFDLYHEMAVVSPPNANGLFYSGTILKFSGRTDPHKIEYYFSTPPKEKPPFPVIRRLLIDSPSD